MTLRSQEMLTASKLPEARAQVAHLRKLLDERKENYVEELSRLKALHKIKILKIREQIENRKVCMNIKIIYTVTIIFFS